MIRTARPALGARRPKTIAEIIKAVARKHARKLIEDRGKLPPVTVAYVSAIAHVRNPYFVMLSPGNAT